MKYCKKCLTPDTRPLTSFDGDGVCGACRWSEEKKNVDWEKRRADLEGLCDEFRGDNGFDMIVPCSGGKDGSYVAWKMQHEFGMKPLCVTFAPPIWSDLGKSNLERFIQSGFSHIQINPPPQVYKALNKRGFIRDGYPKRGFVAGLAPSVTKVAMGLGIRFIMWGEHEEEYEGQTDYHKPTYKADYDFFLQGDDFCGHDPAEYLDQFSEKEFWWWLMPSQDEMDEAGIYHTHFSKFEPWDDEMHRKVAVDKCGLQGSDGTNVGTFTTHSQVDDLLQPLFMYLAFVKFGFGRATADVNLGIRLGRMTREEGVEIVRRKEGSFPLEHMNAYQEYFEMDQKEFWNTIRSWVNWDILDERPKSEPDYWSRPFVLKEEPH